MLKVIISKGLPASGKSTWAKQYIKDNPKTKIINKDSLRAMLDNGLWSKSNEKFIVAARDALIVLALDSNYNVIVDDTNLHPSHEAHIREMAKAYADPKVTVEIKDFTDVPLEECIKRDQGRQNYVGEKVIRGMYNDYLKPAKVLPPVVEWSSELPNVIICDIDGTLALFGDANPYDRDFSKDTLNKIVQSILFHYAVADVILVSGRTDKFREQTEQWLLNNSVEYIELFMRKDGDTRKDVIIKQEIYEAEIKGKYNVLFVLDDRNQVVDFWRAQGLTCLQVAEGDF